MNKKENKIYLAKNELQMDCMNCLTLIDKI